MIGFITLGLGCAPIYPAMLHETPNRFGKNISQSIMGIQMAFAYVGSTFVPPIVGYFFSATSFGFFPLILLALTILMLITTENINRLLLNQK